MLNNDTLRFIRRDATRYTGNITLRNYLVLFLQMPGFRFMIWHRMASRFRRGPLYLFAWYMMSTMKDKFDIPVDAHIGEGFYVNPGGGVTLSSKVKIGSNCTMSEGVTVWHSSRDSEEKAASIGNGVYLGPGSKVIGGVTVGNNAFICANAVVLDDVPDNAVVDGIPATLIAYRMQPHMQP